MRKLMLLCASLCAMAFAVPPKQAHAASDHTWVSANGSDSNGCAQASPCATFAYAVTQTSSGGEISCLSDGDYRTVLITQSITIDCGSNVGTIGQPTINSNAIVIEGNGSSVTLRHLSLKGFGAGQAGISIPSAVSSNINLVVDNCIIDGFAGGSGGLEAGIYFNPGGSRDSLTVSNTVITGSNGAAGSGILVQPSGSAIVSVSLVGGLIQNNTNGVYFNASGGVIAGVVVNSRLIENTGSGITVSGTDYITVDSSTVADNLVTGIASQSSGANVAVTNSTITGNGTGVMGAAVTSFGNNRLFLNGTNGSFGGTQPLQ